MDINKMTNEELLDKFERIISELEGKAQANTENEPLLYRIAISDARERLEQLKLGMY
jgi:hypothetical protein